MDRQHHRFVKQSVSFFLIYCQIVTFISFIEIFVCLSRKRTAYGNRYHSLLSWITYSTTFRIHWLSKVFRTCCNPFPRAENRIQTSIWTTKMHTVNKNRFYVVSERNNLLSLSQHQNCIHHRKWQDFFEQSRDCWKAWTTCYWSIHIHYDFHSINTLKRT